MNTKQLTVLWYGVLAGVGILLIQTEGDPWPSLGAVALVTAVLIYTLGPLHTARLGRVAAAVAAPFVLAGLGISAFYGYRSWQHSVVADAMTVWDVRVTEKPDCPPAADSADDSSSGTGSQAGVLSLGYLDTPPDCHRIAGILHNGSRYEADKVQLRASVFDSTGNPETAWVRVSYVPPGEKTTFMKSLRLSPAVKAQAVDSVVITEVEVDGSAWPF